MARATFSMGDFFLRWLGALILVMLTFNPTSYSYVNWVLMNWPGDLPVKALVGVVLLIVYIIYLRATWRSIGALGVTLAVMLFGAIVWVLIDYGWLDPTESNVMAWVVLMVIATILAIGMSWSHVRRSLTGQVDVDDVDQE